MRRIGLAATLVVVAGCKAPDKKKVDAYVTTSVALSEIDLALTKERCARVAKGSSWKAAEEDTRPMFQQYVQAGSAAVAAGDALAKSDPPGSLLDQQTKAREAGKVWSDKKDAFQKTCVERQGKGPELDAARAGMEKARDAYVTELRGMQKL